MYDTKWTKEELCHFFDNKLIGYNIHIHHQLETMSLFAITDIVTYILQFLTPQDGMRIRSVSKSVHQIINQHSIFWKSLIKRYFPTPIYKSIKPSNSPVFWKVKFFQLGRKTVVVHLKIGGKFVFQQVQTSLTQNAKLNFTAKVSCPKIPLNVEFQEKAKTCIQFHFKVPQNIKSKHSCS